MMKKYKLLIVGCGELGSRHLQAVSSLPEVNDVHIVDPKPEALKLGQSRLTEISDLNRNIKFSWSSEFNKSSSAGDLCVVATQAKGRCALIKEISKNLEYNEFLIEKIVSQSVEEYKSLMSFCETNNLSVWVNCKERAYGIHKYIKSRLNPNESIVFTILGGNHGLANNGIHAVDLFSYYDEGKQINNMYSRIDSTLHPSKRGKDIFDLSGVLYGRSEKGCDFMLNFAGNHESPGIITIISPSRRFIVDHFRKFAYENYAETDWQWNKIPIDEDWNVSHMSKKFVWDILTKNSCDLPTLKECYPAHDFILNTTLPYFNQLLGTDNNYCPVT
ncbi:MAG: hypothetical protein FJZ11_02370 [Candidatus Omnitrophica bacterium]|nr:hypothetical protein [Candidatus Omnitrophota bacterium]